MTHKTKMPEPVTYAHFTPEGLIRMWSREKTNLQAVTDSLEREPEALITTTQAEAYADARVREALQVVADTVEQYHPKATPKGIAAAIRLIASTDGLTAPPLPGPVEPTT